MMTQKCELLYVGDHSGTANTAVQQEHHKAGRALGGLADEVSRGGQQGPCIPAKAMKPTL